ncbi:thioesterase-like superfamily-domain-containing protein [Colletotrichum cereale]|nr:thioesterase-like superfamily-domain-containing protein [Colletotrichum cereale]
MRNSFALGARLARAAPVRIIPQRRSLATSAPCLAATATAAAAAHAPSPAPAHADANGGAAAAALTPRWLSELQARITRCAGRGLQGRRAEELEAVRNAVDAQWLELFAGREGFLTGPGWRGLDRHTVTWGDQDAMVRYGAHPPGSGTNGSSRFAGHVNNVVYNKYAESARFNWLRNFATAVDPEHADHWNAFLSSRDVGLIMRSMKTDYKFPMAYPDHVTVLHKLVSKPSYGADYILLEALLISDVHRRPAARCFEDIVVYDYKSAKRAPLKPFMVDRLRETYEAQEESRAACERKVRALIEAVARLDSAA